MVPVALQSITKASGLRFAYDGLTDEAPSAGRPDERSVRPRSSRASSGGARSPITSTAAPKRLNSASRAPAPGSILANARHYVELAAQYRAELRVDERYA